MLFDIRYIYAVHMWYIYLFTPSSWIFSQKKLIHLDPWKIMIYSMCNFWLWKHIFFCCRCKLKPYPINHINKLVNLSWRSANFRIRSMFCLDSFGNRFIHFKCSLERPLNFFLSNLWTLIELSSMKSRVLTVKNYVLILVFQ